MQKEGDLDFRNKKTFPEEVMKKTSEEILANFLG
jgi:hypothetical protein